MQEFINQLRLAWLYAPDNIIQQSHAVLDTVHTARQPLATDTEKEIALGNVLAAIRQDLFRPGLMVWRRSKLRNEDFRHVRPNRRRMLFVPAFRSRFLGRAARAC